MFATRRTARLGGGGGQHSEDCPPVHRKFCCASVGSAAPGGYCLAPSVGDQTSENRGFITLAHMTLDRVGTDRMSKLMIPSLNGVSSQRE
jgi:hypothetical protein